MIKNIIVALILIFALPAGMFAASVLDVDQGGTGASSLTDGGVLLGSGTDPITAMSVLGDGEFIVGDGTTDPVAESGATVRTSLGLGTGDSPTFTALTVSGSSSTFNGVGYTFPSDDGTSGQVLHTDGAGILSWDTDDSGAGGGFNWNFVTANGISPTTTGVGIIVNASSTFNATTTITNLKVSSAVSILGEYFTNFTTYVRSLFTAGDGLNVSSGQFSFDCSEVTDSAGDHLGCSTEDITVDDDFILNNADDSTTGKLTITGGIQSNASSTIAGNLYVSGSFESPNDITIGAEDGGTVCFGANCNAYIAHAVGFGVQNFATASTTAFSVFSADNAGGTVGAIFNISGISSTNKTFTFPNVSGTLALTSDIGGSTNWQNNGPNAISVTSTDTGIILGPTASSTIDKLSMTYSTTTYATSTNLGVTNLRVSATSTTVGLKVTGAIDAMGEVFSNFTTYVRSLFTGGAGIAITAGDITFDCSEVEGVGIDCSGEAITLNATGDWTGTLDNIEGANFLRSDTADTSAGIITFTNGFISSSSATTTGIHYMENQTTSFNGILYGFPVADGSNGQVLHTDGNGNLSWNTDDSTAGGGSNWNFEGANAITPTTTVGIMVHASSTFDTATTTITNLRVSSIVNFLGESFTNFTTYVRSLFTGGTGIAITNGDVTFDCSEVEGVGIDCSGEAITLNATGDWTGTLDTFEGASFAQVSGDVYTGVHDFGGATSLEIPNNGTVNANGEITTDDTTGKLRYYAGSAERVIPPSYFASFTYSTTTWSGTTTIPLGPAFIAESWNNVKCFTNVGTTFVKFNDGTNNMNGFTASTTVGNVTLSSNNTFTASEKRYATVGSPATSPTSLSCTLSKTFTAD